eukprot:15671-Prorocentrum_minimum.AAC.1
MSTWRISHACYDDTVCMRMIRRRFTPAPCWTLWTPARRRDCVASPKRLRMSAPLRRVAALISITVYPSSAAEAYTAA